VIGDALGDPTVVLAIAASDQAGYVDVKGEDLELPHDPRERAVVPVTREGRPVGAVIHNPAVVEDVAVVEGLAVTSLMLLENNQLLIDLNASRVRTAGAAGRERMLIERDLHDGAQQQLVALQMRLSLILERVDEPGLATELESVAQTADAAIEQLRNLARGIYPPELQ
jgi:signal transduction histidine kinase